MNRFIRSLALRVRQQVTTRRMLIIEHMEVDLVFSRLFDKPHLRILDIGAHHGEFLDIFELHNHPHTYEVICVEPMAENVTRLQAKTRQLQRVRATVCPVAISSESGHRPFYAGSADTLFTCSTDWKDHFPDHFRDAREITTECLTPTDLARRFGVDIHRPFDFIKIDTEGHDLQVLRALVNDDVQSSAIMFEVGPRLDDVASSVNLLRDCAFSEFYIFGRGGIPTLFIGEYSGQEQLATLRKQGRLDAGNVVAFHTSIAYHAESTRG